MDVTAPGPPTKVQGEGHPDTQAPCTGHLRLQLRCRRTGPGLVFQWDVEMTQDKAPRRPHGSTDQATFKGKGEEKPNNRRNGPLGAVLDV